MITFNLNGRKVEVDCEPMDRLSDVLRNTLGLKGTKVGCNSGDCGSCSIIFDEDLCCSCLLPMGQIDGGDITTIEGLRDGQALSDMQLSLIHI